MVDFIHRKGRQRKYVGLLRSFDDLHEDKQNIFKKIKNEIKRELGGDVNVYVFGSYAWGYADEKSDFDVRVDKPLPTNKHIGRMISEKINKEVHIQYLTKNIKETPLIP